MAWTVYILQSEKDGKHYIGCTSDLGRRLREHNAGHTVSIRDRRPFRIVYQEHYEKQCEAFARERTIKRYKGGEAFKKLVG